VSASPPSPDDPDAPDRPEAPSGRRAAVITLVAGAAAALAYLALPASLDPLARRVVPIFVVAAVFWATEVIPLWATSLLVVGLEVLLLADEGGLAGQGDIGYQEFLAPFASNVVMLFFGGLLLSAAVQRHALDLAIASRCLGPFTQRPVRLLLAVMLITAFLSMWMSNTATTAMMLVIVAPLLARLPPAEPFRQALVLAVPVAANVGGIGTPIGTPPNAIALGALRQAGLTVSFLDWMLLAVPLAAVVLAAAAGLLVLFHRPAPGLRIAAIPAPPPMTAQAWFTLAVLGVAIALWLTGAWHGLPDGVIALLAAVALAVRGAVDRAAVNGIDWSVLLLLWGGLALGRAIEVTGLIDAVTALPLAELGGPLLAAIVIAVSLGLATFMSNTAAAALLVPLTLALATPNRGQLVVLAALSTSFAMAMPVSTPPNALAFATGELRPTALLRVGACVGLLATVMMLLGYWIVLPLVIPGL